MDIRQLQYLSALAQERHFTRAAQRCNVTQPTLSGRIRQLEQELGVPIVERDHRYHALTAEGERVLRWAETILDNCDAMRQELSALKGGLSGRLALGVIPSALPMVVAVSGAMRARYPSVAVSVHSRTSDKILREVEAFHFDAGITYLDNEPIERMETRHLYDEHYQLFLPAEHEWANRESVTWAEAAALPLCLLTPNMQNRRIINGAFHAAQCSPVAEIETDSVVALWSHVRFGGWASIMPAYFSELFGNESTVHSIPLVEPEVRHQVGLVTLARDPLSPIVAALFEVCRDTPLFPLAGDHLLAAESG
ncbi:MAG: LysR family transcriptional regulator [Salinisphaeraceae bacterium]